MLRLTHSLRRAMPILKKPAVQKRPARCWAGMAAAARCKNASSDRCIASSDRGIAVDSAAPSDLPEEGKRPKARNPFQLFYANCLRLGEVTNSSEASEKWRLLSDVEQSGWRQKACLEKKMQVEFQHAKGVAIRITPAVRAAVTFTIDNDVVLEPERQTPLQQVAGDPVLGGYQLEWHNRNSTRGSVAEGSFGVAFRGFCPRTRMQVAVKIYRHDQESRSDLEHEVEICKRLGECRHGFFLSVLEAGVAAPIPYLVLPWVGDSLSCVLASRRTQNPCRIISADIVCIVFVQVADALRYMHSVGITHTDIKPSNVLIRECDRRAIVIDFNMAEVVTGDNWVPRGSCYSTYPWRAPSCGARARHSCYDAWWHLLSTSGRMGSCVWRR